MERIKCRRDFLEVAKTRRKWAAPGVVMQVRRTSGPGFRVGFTVTKKVGNAVERNRVRRRLRAAASQILPGSASLGHDYVLIGRRATLHRPFGDIKADILDALVHLKTCRPAEKTS